MGCKHSWFRLWRQRSTGFASLTGWNASGKGYKGGVMPFMEFSDRDPIPKWDFQEPGARLKPWLRELSFWQHDTSIPLNRLGVRRYNSLFSEQILGVWQSKVSEHQICSGQGFDLIIGAIRQTAFDRICRQYPDGTDQNYASYQSTRSPKGTFVEYTSRTSNKHRRTQRVISKSWIGIPKMNRFYHQATTPS